MKEAYVSFDVAKLLKEKGFDWGCCSYWCIFPNGDRVHTDYGHFANHNGDETDRFVSRPTQQMAMRWLWEEKGLNINAVYGDYPSMKKAYWMPQIDSLDTCYGVDDEDFFGEYDSREECIEAALEYALRNLI